MSKVKVDNTLSDLKAKRDKLMMAKIFKEPYSKEELKEIQAKIDYIEYGIKC